MEAMLHEVIGTEIRRRHGVGMMEGKLKPVHVANALMRAEHGTVGRMADLKLLMTATAPKESTDGKLEAARQMLERNRERWGRLGEVDDLRRSTLVSKVLPLLRTILATDGAAFGSSPDQSSFSSPTALTVTGDPSDDHAGDFVFRLWEDPEGGQRLKLLDILRDATSPNKKPEEVDDLSAVLIPLTDEVREKRRTVWKYLDLTPERKSAIATSLRAAAMDLGRYEESSRPNPMASLQRIVTLASVSVFMHAASRPSEWGEWPRRVLFLDASGSRHTRAAEISELLVKRLMDDARDYMARILQDLLDETSPDWDRNPDVGLSDLAQVKFAKKNPINVKKLREILDEISDSDGDMRSEFPARLIELIDGSSGRSLDGFLRLFGVRSGLLYPQQKNPTKRLLPADRTLEVLVVTTFNAVGAPLEYRDFLDAFYQRWGILVGGRSEDGALLAEAGVDIDSASLGENSERFLTRLEALGLARRLADSVAVVGVRESQ